MKSTKTIIAALAVLAVAASAAFAGDKKPHKPPQKSEKDSKWSLSLGFGSGDFGIFGGFFEAQALSASAAVKAYNSCFLLPI